ncbi:MAG: T9SS type A sorting domain-containing protein [Saprospiraceae bacterium]|nr:T9SS type A sorting domain-containing protein [Saprospiraceae bacterium]
MYTSETDTNADTQRFSINTNSWANGTYFVKLNIGNQYDYCRLVIIKN